MNASVSNGETGWAFHEHTEHGRLYACLSCSPTTFSLDPTEPCPTCGEEEPMRTMTKAKRTMVGRGGSYKVMENGKVIGRLVFTDRWVNQTWARRCLKWKLDGTHVEMFYAYVRDVKRDLDELDF